MGAYENPRFFSAPDVTAGAKAFIGTFQRGLEKGVKIGEELIENRKEYEAGIYEQGKALENELQAAVDNNLKTQEEMKVALRSFYDEALKVEMPTKKGIGGLFATAKEKRLGEIDLQEMQRSFTSAVTPVNAMYDYAYTSGLDIDENEDKGSKFYADKRLIHDAIKSGNIKTNIEYVKAKGFQSNIQVLDNNGNIVKEYSPQLAQTIFTASGKEQRDIIDQNHDELEKGVMNQVQANVANEVEKAKTFGYRTYAEGEKEARSVIQRTLGTANLGDDDLPSEKTLKLINDEYNNHANLNLETKRDIMRKSMSSLVSLEDDELDAIINEPMLIGSTRFQEILKDKGFDNEQIGLIYKRSLKGKAGIVEQALFQEVQEKGLLDKGYAPKQEKIKPGAGGATAVNKAFGDQQVNRLIDLQRTILDKQNPPVQGGGVDVIDRDINTPIALDRAGGELEGIRTLNIENKSRYITNAFVDPATKRITIGYVANRKIIEGKEEGSEAIQIGEKDIEKTLEFDLLDPRSMNELFDMIGGTTGEQDSATEKYYNTYFGQNAWKVYDQNLDLLNKPGMEKWQAEVVKKKGLENAKKDSRYVNSAWFQNYIRNSQKIK